MAKQGFHVSYNAPVILTFSLLALAVYLITDIVSADFTTNYFVARPEPHEARDYLGLVTHILGHGNWAHLLGNFSLILLIGPLLEKEHGSGSLLLMILITALVTGVINWVFLDTGLLGASGIVFMCILLASTANIRQGEIPLTFVLVAILYLGKEVVQAFENDQISQMGHLVGGAAGAAFGFLSAGMSKSGGGSFMLPKQ